MTGIWARLKRRVMLASVSVAALAGVYIVDSALNPPPYFAPGPHTGASPLPDYTGDLRSARQGGALGQSDGAPQLTAAAPVNSDGPPADCSRRAIIYYASRAPSVFETDRKGRLYDVETHTPATRSGDVPGFNSCALVAYAILKKAGCGWVKYTASAKGLYDMVAAKGWRRTERQEGGCVVAWNSRWDGKRERIGPGSDDRRRTAFRHVGVTTGGWISVDNTSLSSRPTAFFTWRPYRYEWPMFLCPPQTAPEPKTQ